MGQCIPDGLLVTIPVPGAGGVTVTWNNGGECGGGVEATPVPQLVRRVVEIESAIETAKKRRALETARPTLQKSDIR